MTLASFIVRIFYASAFTFASVENWAAFIESFPTQGWRIEGVPLLSAIYFLSLLLIDPVVGALLLLRPKVGLVLAGVIVSTNVAHNTWLIRYTKSSPDSLYWLTVAFLVFYVLTITPVWRRVHRNAPSPEEPNKSPEPTPTSVMPAAGQPSRQE